MSIDPIAQRVSTAHCHPNREAGFTFLAVLFAVVILSIVGSAAYLFGSTDGSSAEATALRSQALAAAETGLTIFSTSADPSSIANELDSMDSLTPVDLPILGSTDGTRAQYVIAGAGNGSGLGHVVVEGRILRNNRVVSRARLSGTLLIEQRDEPYEGTAGQGPTGANVQRGGRRPFVGGPGL